MAPASLEAHRVGDHQGADLLVRHAGIATSIAVRGAYGQLNHVAKSSSLIDGSHDRCAHASGRWSAEGSDRALPAVSAAWRFPAVQPVGRVPVEHRPVVSDIANAVGHQADAVPPA